MAVATAGTATVAEAASATSLACSVPAGVTAGELLLASVTHSSSAAIPNQTGWSMVGQAASGSTGISTAMFWRWATASEPASYTFTGLASGAVSAEMTRLTGVNTTSPLDSAPVTAGSAATGTFTMPAVGTATPGALVASTVALYSIGSSISAGTGNPATIIANTTGTGRRAILASEPRPTAGSLGTRTWTSGTSAKWAGVTVAIKPATSSGVSVTVTGATATATASAVGGSLTLGPSVGVAIAGATALATVVTAAGVVVVPHLSITVTAEPDFLPPRLRIDVVDNRSTPATQVTITRRDPDGSSHPVRTADGGPLTLSGGLGTAYDYEAPYDSPLVFSTDQSTDVVTGEMDGIVDTWLVHPGVPAFSQRVDFRMGTDDAQTWDINQSVYAILGADAPVVITGSPRLQPATRLVLSTETLAELAALKTLLADGSALLLNVPPSDGSGVDRAYVSVGQVRVTRRSTVGTDQSRDVELPCQVVGRPGGGTLAAVTWDTVAAQYPTWQSIIDAGITSWAELAAPSS